MNFSLFKCNCDLTKVNKDSAEIRVLINLVLANQRTINSKLEKIMSLSDDILDEARQANTVGDSIIALVEKLVAQSGGDPAKLLEALEIMKAQRAETEAAILANTPQEPATE